MINDLIELYRQYLSENNQQQASIMFNKISAKVNDFVNQKYSDLYEQQQQIVEMINNVKTQDDVEKIVVNIKQLDGKLQQAKDKLLSEIPDERIKQFVEKHLNETKNS